MRTVVALVLALLGVAAFHSGLDARAAAEPPDLVAGEGLLVGSETAADTEIRSRPLMVPTPALRTRGRGGRALGAGLLALALTLVALRPVRPGAKRAARWARVVWVVPGVLGLARLVVRAGAAAPTVEVARDAATEGLALYALSFVLLAAWRA